jgi:hypothetical protein
MRELSQKRWRPVNDQNWATRVRAKPLWLRPEPPFRGSIDWHRGDVILTLIRPPGASLLCPFMGEGGVRFAVEKYSLFVVLLIAACGAAGLYGALHNQISYTVSPEYFHAFKFQQFGIPKDLQGRLGASIVGWHASWWMGLLIGVPVLLVGLILPGWQVYLPRCLMAYAVIAATALVVGLIALLYATLTISEASLPSHWCPPEVCDKVAFARAGTMHNFSYLGGFLGIITGSLYLLVERLRWW